MGVKVDSKTRLVVTARGHRWLVACAIALGAVGIGLLALGLVNREPIAAVAGVVILVVGVVPPEYGAKGLRVDLDERGDRVVVRSVGGITGCTLERTVYPAAEVRAAEVCFIGGVADLPSVYDEHGDVQSTPRDVEWHRYDVVLGEQRIYSTPDEDVAEHLANRLSDVASRVDA